MSELAIQNPQAEGEMAPGTAVYFVTDAGNSRCVETGIVVESSSHDTPCPSLTIRRHGDLAIQKSDVLTGLNPESVFTQDEVAAILESEVVKRKAARSLFMNGEFER